MKKAYSFIAVLALLSQLSGALACLVPKYLYLFILAAAKILVERVFSIGSLLRCLLRQCLKAFICIRFSDLHLPQKRFLLIITCNYHASARYICTTDKPQLFSTIEQESLTRLSTIRQPYLHLGLSKVQ